ncbi:Helix-turn-helix, Fis-type [Pseudomonas coronafaciens pv. garcae]|uniref:Helix-turn-helix, Fis-type n=2 Tax=Pseudomonas syringae group TaxID=136849 RepID=A0AB37QIN5_9PSED|nr:Helix-turn-helix, Fis-type [Pseudomonas coronafaciens pv. garcae]
MQLDAGRQGLFMHLSAPPRRLLIIDANDDFHQLTQALDETGWTVQRGTLDSARDAGYDVGLIHLTSDHFEHPEQIEGLLSGTRKQWIALLAPDDLRHEQSSEFVCKRFFDVHSLPFDMGRMQISLDRAFAAGCVPASGTPPAPAAEPEMLGESRPLRALRRLLSKLAPTDSPVLIRGERGTGKKLIARSLHAQSQRHSKPFVVVDCGSAPEHSIHAELFGYEKGAFEGALERSAGQIEAAHGGTLLLDEVGDLPLEAQAHLVRFLEERQVQRLGGIESTAVDIRVLATTREDLEAAVGKKRFREDLYYQLNVLQVGTAPLRERHGDLALLANHFVHRHSVETGRKARSFSQDALVALGKHDWPGNVSELVSRVRRGLMLAQGRQIEAANLGLQGEEENAGSMDTLDEYKSRAERQALCEVLTRHSHNMSAAAKVLGISRPTFYRLLHKHQIR